MKIMSPHVVVSQSGGVLTLSLNRPEKKNALSDEMYGALADAMAAAEADPAVKVMLIRGEGGSFTVGNDLADFAKANAEGNASINDDQNVGRFLKALAKATKPLVAAVKGHAVGVGATMLLHCDLVYVAEDAKLSTPFVNLALSPEAASSLTLPSRIGHARAFAMFALGEVVSGVTAAAWGIANAALPAGEVEAKARAAADLLCTRPLGAVITTKALMRDVDALAGRMDEEGVLFAARLETPEAAEAFAAFAERRPPDFSKLA
jgi:enoyl-CoA hydratase/carnithine racemase